MNRINFNGQNGVATSAVKVVVKDNRNNGGNYKWQIEKINVIKEYFNDDFFNDDLGQYIEVEIVVNSREVFPRVSFNGDYYVPEASAFQSSKKSVSDMVASMTEMIKNIAVEYGYIESDFYPTSWVNVTPNVFGTMVKSVFGTMGEQDNEQEQDDAAIEYLREVMPVIPVDIISEKIDECVEDLCLVEDGKRMDFDKFCDVLWNDYVWDEVFTDEALENDTREWMEFNDRVRYIIENEKENIFITYDDEIVGEIAPNNDTPILDNDIDRVVNTIKNYVDNYEGLMMDYDGHNASICVPWDEFSENDMQMLIEDDIFEGLVIDSLVGENISDMLVYDDGVYVTVDYDKMFNKVA